MSASIVPGSEGAVVSGGLGVVGGRLARGVPFMSGRRDVPLFVHGEREREWGAWCWLDRSLVVVERLVPMGGLGGPVEALPSTPPMTTATVAMLVLSVVVLVVVCMCVWGRCWRGLVGM